MAMQIFESHSSVVWQTTWLQKDCLEMSWFMWCLRNSQTAWVAGYFYSPSRVNVNEVQEMEKLRKVYQVRWSL